MRFPLFHSRSGLRFYLLRSIALNILLVLAVFTGNVWQVYRTGNQTLPAAATADTAMVFGAVAQSRQPLPVFLERINHTIVLHQSHRVGKIVLTGDTPKEGCTTEAGVGRRYALKQGTPARSILFKNTSRSTYENLHNIRPTLRTNSVDSVIVVSGPYHLAHAQAIIRDLDLNAEVSATSTTRFNARGKKGRFLFQESYLLFLYQFESWGGRIWDWIICNG